MKIIADENIPLLQHYFAPYGDIILKPGRDISNQDLQNADVLLVRSVTKVNENLLKNTSIKFVGSTTSGYDHLDVDYLEKNKIQWAIAKGCNAEAVKEYLLSCIAALQTKSFLTKKNSRAGVIGLGEIGQRVANQLKEIGFEVLSYDPFRHDLPPTTLDDFQDLDLITLHVPLTSKGSHPTFHLIEKNFLSRQKENCVLINASRGEVVSFEDLKRHGKHLIWCLDVWENEPMIDPEVLQNAFIATPHIAGYSVESKYRGIEMIYQQCLEHNILPNKNIPAIQYPTQKMKVKTLPQSWQEKMLLLFNPFEWTEKMKNHSDHFDVLRKSCNNRHESKFVCFDVWVV